MSDKIYFTPGPSGLYPTVASHIQSALLNDVCSLSHRSKKYESIHTSTVEAIRELLQIPSDFHIFFTGSATEIWDRVLENCVEENSFHLVNGSFSKRFYETAKELNKNPKKFEVAFGKGFNTSEITVPEAELLCMTHNETSSGVMMPLSDIYSIRNQKPDSLLVIDAVSSIPYPIFDFTLVDSVLFSVQKGFGLPAGLGVWVVNNKCIEKANLIATKGKSIGSYHSLPSLLSKSVSNQTPETPNVLGIYLLGKVAQDILNRGADKVRKETELKASLLYDYIEKSANFSAFVENPAHRSTTVVVANTILPSPQINPLLEKYNMSIGTGYGKTKDQQVRIANFPGHSVEQIEELISNLKKSIA
jgi:phosphoserine aminotransferase